MSTDYNSSEIPPGNSVTNSSTAVHYLEPRWIAGEVMLLVITLATVYIFLALLHYSWRFRNMARVGGSGHELRERYLHFSCAAVVLIAIARCVLHQIVAFLPKGRNDELDTCRTMMIASRIVYNLAICLTYVHLWLRQHMFYTKDEVKGLRTKALEIIDWAVLVIIISTSVVVAIVAFVPLNGQDTWKIYHEDKCSVFGYSSPEALFIYAGLSLLYQLILILLFLYPILMQKRQKKNGRPNAVPKTQATAKSDSPTLWIGIRRGFVLTVAVILTDAASGYLVYVLSKKYPNLLSSIIGLNDVNLLFNVVCCICTFRNWKKIVFGFRPCRHMGWHHDYHVRTNIRTSFKRQTEVENGAYVDRRSCEGIGGLPDAEGPKNNGEAQ